MWSEEEAQAAYFSMMKASHYFMVGDVLPVECLELECKTYSY
jgi:hypothetical protein